MLIDNNIMLSTRPKLCRSTLHSYRFQIAEAHRIDASPLQLLACRGLAQIVHALLSATPDTIRCVNRVTARCTNRVSAGVRSLSIRNGHGVLVLTHNARVVAALWVMSRGTSSLRQLRTSEFARAAGESKEDAPKSVFDTLISESAEGV